MIPFLRGGKVGHAPNNNLGLTLTKNKNASHPKMAGIYINPVYVVRFVHEIQKPKEFGCSPNYSGHAHKF
jgi:hypothetical protein